MNDTPLNGSRKATLGFIFATAAMDVLALGVMIPVLPNLVKQFSGGDTALASEWTTLFATAWGLMQFFCSPILGLLSDRYGRRPVLLTSIFGLGIDYLFMAFAPSLWWLFAGRLINGATSASFSTTSAYIADITPPEKRAQSFGLVGAAWSVGFILGPALGGWLAAFDLRLPFLVCAGLALTNWLYGLLVLPESLPRNKRVQRFDWSKANPLGSLQLLTRHQALIKLATVNFLYQLAHNVFPTIFVLYAGYRYGWNPAITGLTLMGNGLCNALVQVFLVGPVVKRLGERGTLLTGLVGGVLGFSIFALAPTGMIYLTSIPLFALMGLVQPSLQGLMTRNVADHEQDQLQGANSCIMGITAIIGPPIFGLTFAWSIHHKMLPGLAILIGAGFMLTSLTLILLAPTKSGLSSSVVVLPDAALETESAQSAG